MRSCPDRNALEVLAMPIDPIIASSATVAVAACGAAGKLVHRVNKLEQAKEAQKVWNENFDKKIDHLTDIVERQAGLR